MLVATKLHIPSPPASSMPRRRVTRILQAGLRRRLTLVSAPMGFGKTTVVRDLVSAVDQPYAWLSLNAGDNDPVRFWQYVIAALQTIQPGIGQTAQGLLDAPRADPGRAGRLHSPVCGRRRSHGGSPQGGGQPWYDTGLYWHPPRGLS